jgi:hypothetical protein
MIQDAGGAVTDRVLLVFGGGSWLAGGGAARCARGGTGSDCAGRPPFWVAGMGVADQEGAGRAHSRRQQARNASFHGQVRLSFRVRARAWRTSRAGRLSSR